MQVTMNFIIRSMLCTAVYTEPLLLITNCSFRSFDCCGILSSSSAAFSSSFGLILRYSAQLRHTLTQVCVLFLVLLFLAFSFSFCSSSSPETAKRPSSTFLFCFQIYRAWLRLRFVAIETTYSHRVHFEINCVPLVQSETSTFVECAIKVKIRVPVST